MTLSSEILAALASLNALVVGYLATCIRTLGRKLDNMVCDPLCKERSEKCQKALCTKLASIETKVDEVKHCKEEEHRELWDRINRHQHDERGRVVVG